MVALRSALLGLRVPLAPVTERVGRVVLVGLLASRAKEAELVCVAGSQCSSYTLYSLARHRVNASSVQLLPLALGTKVLGLGETAEGALGIANGCAEVAKFTLGGFVAFTRGGHVWV